MSKRYGRKQKTKARETIAGLQNRLNRESTAHMYLPAADVPVLVSYAFVLDYRVTEDGAADDVVRRSADVTVEPPCEDLLTMMHHRTPVQFMGHQYIIVNASHTPGFEVERVELEMVGVA